MPDFMVRVREINNYRTLVRADSYEEALNAVQKAIDEADDVIEGLALREGSAGFETDGADEVNDGFDPDMHQHELTCDPDLDTSSSASRQHWIETGLYLTHTEVEIAEAAERSQARAAYDARVSAVVAAQPIPPHHKARGSLR